MKNFVWVTYMINNKVNKVLALLDKYYNDCHCYLNYKTDWQLLIATILSAQCTDKRVNLVTDVLFEKYKTLADFAYAQQTELEKDIKSTGFYKNKAKYIILSSKELLKNYKSMPSDINILTKLPGVGRKTANVIRSNIFNIPSVVVDTHVKRVSRRLGFAKGNNPNKIEIELMKILPKSHWIRYNYQIMTHGQKVCKARHANCCDCFLNNLCMTGVSLVSNA
jgi:endonuclease-3